MKVLVLPRDDNPYQERLYDALAQAGIRRRYVGGLTSSHTLNLLALPLELVVARLRGWDVLHVHWVFGFAPPGARRLPALRRAARLWFQFVLGLVRRLGMRLVWTAHNTLPHERVFDDDVRARRALVAASDLVVAHSQATLDALAELGARPRRSVVVPLGTYGPSPAEAATLRRPGAGAGPRHVLFFGKVLAYKGVEDLLDAAAALAPDLPLALTVAGECPDAGLAARLQELARAAPVDVRLRLSRVPDEQVTPLLSSADAVVLPFREVTTSSTVALAMAYRRPVVLPDVPPFEELPDAAVIRYDGSAGALVGALTQIARADAGELAERGAAAGDATDSRGWPEVARRMLAALEAPTVTVDARYLKRAGIGVSVYLRGAIGRLRGAGIALVLLTDDEPHAAALMREHVGANVRVVVLPRRSGFLWEQWDLPRYLRRTRPQAHLAGANYGLPLLPAGGARLMLVVHDLIPLRMPRSYLLNRPAWAAKYLLSVGIALWRASTVLVPSRATAQDVSRLLRRDKVRVRYPSAVAANGNEPAALPPDWPAEYVLYNGGFDPRKNVDGLLEAFALYRRSGGSHKLAILGEAPAGGLSAARRLGIEAELWLPGYVDDETKNAAVASAAAVVYPSRWEGFGLPVLEALTAGVPVVTGTGGSLREVGGDAVVYVDVRDPASIAAGISRAVTPSERRRLAPRAARQLRLLSTSAHDDPVLSFAP